MVARDRPTDWDAHPRRSHDRRRSKPTSCAASRARMDGWWTVTAGCTVVVCLDPTAVLMDRSPDPPAASARGGSSAAPERGLLDQTRDSEDLRLRFQLRHEPDRVVAFDRLQVARAEAVVGQPSHMIDRRAIWEIRPEHDLGGRDQLRQ